MHLILPTCIQRSVETAPKAFVWGVLRSFYKGVKVTEDLHTEISVHGPSPWTWDQEFPGTGLIHHRKKDTLKAH